MKALLVFTLLHSALLKADVGMDLPETYCRYVLSHVLESQRSPTDFLEASPETEAAEALLEGKTKSFSDEHLLAPLFDYGILYSELGTELRAQGATNPTKIKNTLLILSESSDPVPLLSLADEVVRRVLEKVGGLAEGSSPAFRQSYEKRSAGLGIPFEEFVELLKGLRQQSLTQFHLLKLALIIKITRYPKELVDQIPPAPVVSFLRSPKKLPPVEPEAYFGPREINRIVKSKTDYIERTAATKNLDFDRIFLESILGVTKNYYARLTKYDKIRFLAFALGFADKLSTDESFLKFMASVSKLINPAELRGGDDQGTDYLEELRRLKNKYLNTNPARLDAINSLLSSIEKNLQDLTNRETVQGKIFRLEHWQTSPGGFDFFTTLVSELNHIRVNFISVIAENPSQMGRMLLLATTLSDFDQFRTAVDTLKLMTFGKPALEEKLEDALAAYEYKLRENGDAIRADRIHQTYFSGRPVNTPPKSKKFAYFGSGYGGGCFVKGTLVDTPKGPRAIESLRAGDKIYSFDHEQNKVVIGIVEKPLIHFEREVVDLGIDGGVSLRVTPEHSFYAPEKSDYVALENLQIGENTLTRQQQFAKINRVSKGGRVPAVYNLEIKHYHNYFVHGILVHNNKG